MGSHARSLLLAAITLTACAPDQATPAPQPAILAPNDGALARYDDLCEFLPTGMQSYWFSDWRKFTDFEPWRLARAATDFKSPPHIGASGTQTSVEVTDYGAGMQAAFTKQQDQTWIPQEHRLGHPTWQTKSFSTPPQTLWVAFVNSRYEVRATSPKLLMQALAQSGDRRTLLRFVPDTSVLSESATDIIFCLPRPQPTTFMAGPSPTSIMVAQLRLDQRKIDVFTAAPQPQIVTYYDREDLPCTPEAALQGGYHVFRMTFPDMEERTPHPYWMHLAMLFGYHIAI